MHRVFLFAAILVAASPVAHAGQYDNDRACTRELVPRAAERLALAALFERSGESVETTNGVSAPMGPAEVVLVRIGEDGKPVMECVDNEAAARRFLDMPVRQLVPSAAEER